MRKSKISIKRLHRIRRKFSIRKKISGTNTFPRTCVYRSLKHIYIQAIDDDNGHTIVSASTLQPEFLEAKKEKMKKTDQAFLVGEIFAKKCKGKNIDRIRFDRNGFSYHGRVKALADGARKGGLKF
jgi:large subunit ribosomal protein L18